MERPLISLTERVSAKATDSMSATSGWTSWKHQGTPLSRFPSSSGTPILEMTPSLSSREILFSSVMSAAQIFIPTGPKNWPGLFTTLFSVNSCPLGTRLFYARPMAQGPCAGREWHRVNFPPSAMSDRTALRFRKVIEMNSFSTRSMNTIIKLPI